MKKVTAIIVTALAILVSVPPSQAQQTDKVYRIGIITREFASIYKRILDYYRENLSDLGYIEGQNLLFECRYGNGSNDPLPNFVNELVKHKVDVILTSNPVAIRAAKNATKTIPVVMISAIDPVAAGFVDSLARPGGNITGLTRLRDDLIAKRIELLKEAVPQMSRLAVLWDADSPDPAAIFKETEAAARIFKLEVQSFGTRGLISDYEKLFQAAKEARSEALFILGNPTIRRHRKKIIKLAIRDRLPSMTPSRRWVRDGGLMSYRADSTDLRRRAAVFVDKILKGAKPADLPIEQPTKFLLHVNLKTAKELGLTFPPQILMRADKVIQ